VDRIGTGPGRDSEIDWVKAQGDLVAMAIIRNPKFELKKSESKSKKPESGKSEHYFR